jgi:ferric-dicitrate binding protein FerR (iron transport regulator)
MAFARYAYIACCLSDPRGADASAIVTGHDPAQFQARALRGGLTEGDEAGFYAWVQASRLHAAAYDYLCAQEGGGTAVYRDAA